MSNKTKKRLIRIFTVNIPLVVLFIITIFPLYWTIVTSLKPENQIMKLPLKYWPSPITFDNYKYIWNNMGFDIYFWNSVMVTVISTVVCTVVSLFGGYAIARYPYKGKKLTYLILLVSQMFPGVVLMIPLFEIFKNMGIVNSPYSLILTYTTVRIPFCMIMISGFVAGVSPALEEAAQIDGCSVLGAITRIVVPTIAPGLVAAGAFAFVSSWNEYVYAFCFLSSERYFTLPIGLKLMKGEFSVAYGSLAAGCVMALIPVILLFAYIQKYLVSGLSAGAVKG
ncbi:multiple sugar transport system permease protein [Lacrimispora xylanisolvens]|uniref:Multiple sugar transport system permease protein n=1 Tax=Lacrimispora xylanisolvens TaxID=384636 RepID=A0A2S6HY19_9FIRM|nr:carbohydrate ABC transporter permease [Hungatella xylanolytica]MBE5986633.1 carbohydrate ABC transporter permease [Paenibacillaceae bacterium]PPK83065.1 multiple sugar transport system permease protein [Hungatella xylanolytica]